MSRIIVGLAILLTLFGCKQEDRVIDNSRSNVNLYLSDSTKKDVSIYEYPSLKIKKADILASAGIILNSPITTIREYQQKLFLFAPKDDKMIVLDAKNDTVIKVIDFPAKSEPFDIYFSNPVDGFVIFKSIASIANYDLVYNKIAKYMDTKSPVSSIAEYNSYSYVCEIDSMNVSTFDNRIYASDGDVKLTGYPVLASTTSENEIMVITMGYSDDKGTVPAQVHFINTDNKSLRYTREFGDNIIKATEIVPTDIVSTLLGYTFVTSNKGLIRLDARNNGNLIDVSKRIFTMMEYNLELKSLILLEPNGTSANLVQASAITGAVVDVMPLPFNANCFHISY
jgi:hypothetical protein